MFLDVVENNNAIIIQDWVIDLNNDTKTLVFHMASHSYAVCISIH
jgi:hypothetical protein